MKKIIIGLMFGLMLISLVSAGTLWNYSDITFSSNQEVCGNYTYQNIIINNSATLTVCDYNGTAGTGEVNFYAVEDFTMESGTVINGNALGWRGGAGRTGTAGSGNNGEGTGYGHGGGKYEGSDDYGGGGGGAGAYAAGGNGGEAYNDGSPKSDGGISYMINNSLNTYQGSGGGGGGKGTDTGYPAGDGGNGGATIYIQASNLNIHGTIQSTGESGATASCSNYACGGGGGGSGGLITLYADNLNLSSATLSTNAGAGGNGDGGSDDCGQGGGGGSGGLIRKVYETSLDLTSITQNYGGGAGGSGDGSCGVGPDAENGDAGGTGYNMTNQTTYVGIEGGIVTLNSPEDGYNSTENEVEFNCSASIFGGATLVNISLYDNSTGSWEIHNTTIVTGTTNESTWDNTFSSGDTILWTCYACGSDGNCGFASENRTLNIDSEAPNISIIYPTGIISSDWDTKYDTLNLNWSINDTNLEACWYEYNSTNTTVTCGDNTTTFVTVAGETTIKLWANDSFSNSNYSTGSWTWDWYVQNETTYTDCDNISINWTDLLDGTYYYNVTVEFNDSTTNSTETRVVYIDTTYPLISYTASSDATNESANFTDKDNIFVNVSVIETNEANITFWLWTSINSSYNKTTFTDSTRTINWTSLSEDMYFWNVTVCDSANNCNSTSERKFGVETINLTLEGDTANLTAELGTSIQANITSTLGQIYIDIDHPSYGTNYTNATWSTYTDIVIDWFRKTIFSDNNSSKTFTFNSSGNSSNLTFTAHEYDEVVNMSINLSGTSNPTDIGIYSVTNSSNFDRFFYGILKGSNIYENHIHDTSTGIVTYNDTANITFSDFGSKTIYFRLDDGMNLERMTMNVTGGSYGFSYYDEYDDDDYYDEIESSGAIIRGGFILPGGNNLANFSVDAFEDASINTSLWTAAIANGNYNPTPGDGFEYTIANAETGGYLKVYTENFKTDHDLDESGSGTVNNYIYVNYTKLNIFTAQQIVFDLEYYIHGDEEESQQGCTSNTIIKLGDTIVWTSPWQQCEDESPLDCNEYSQTLDRMRFTLDRQINDSWKVTISGTARASGDDYDQGDCGSYEYDYNYTNGSLSKTYQNPGSPCSESNSVESLANTFYITDLEWNTVLQQFNINVYTYGYYDHKYADNGCYEIDAYAQLYFVNQSLYNVSNATFVSESIFDSSGDITSAGLTTGGLSPTGNSLYAYLSADNGNTWDSVDTIGTQNVFSVPGKNIKYKYLFNMTNTGYTTYNPFLSYTNITSPTDDPEDITFDFGNDGTIDYTIDGSINSTNGSVTVNLSSADLSSAFSGTPVATTDHLYLVPLVIDSATLGQLNIDNVNLTYNPNPVSINTTEVQEVVYGLTNESNYNMTISATNGTINVSDIRYDYRGGNDTIQVTAHNADSSETISYWITYFFSRWDYNFVPTNVDWLVFTPFNPNDTDVTPYGQSSSVPILNITNYGYGGKVANLSVYVNDSLDCVNLTMSTDNNKSNGNMVNESWITLDSDLDYLETVDIYMWADYACSYNNWTNFNPYIYLRQCANGTVCSTEVV